MVNEIKIFYCFLTLIIHLNCIGENSRPVKEEVFVKKIVVNPYVPLDSIVKKIQKGMKMDAFIILIL